MNEIQWYYARDEQRFGPVSTVELKRLAERHAITPDDLVWREGMADWVEASQVKGLFQPTPPEPPSGALPTIQQNPRSETLGALPERRGTGPAARHPVEVLLGAARGRASEAFVDSSIALFVLLGHYGMYVAMVLVLIAGTAISYQKSNAAPICLAIAAIPLLAVLQYAAGRFCEALDRVNRSTRAAVASTVLVDLIGLVSMVLGLILLLAVAAWAIGTQQYIIVLSALLAFILCEHLAAVSLVHVDENVIVSEALSPGEEALGTLCALLKAGARVVPVAFGAGVCCSTIVLLVACVECLRGDEAILAGSVMAFSQTGMIALFAALPMLGYLAFLLLALVFDVLDGLLTLRRPEDR